MSRLGKKVNLMKPIDADKIPIRRDTFFPDAYIIELPLDSQPDYVWQTLFEQEWKSSLHLWERKVVVVGNKLVLITTPTQIEEKIDWIKRMVESTNTRVERFNETQQIMEEVEKKEALREHENIIRDALRARLGLI
jgi:hypothetical protein